MVSFESDYVAGAHPELLKRLCETNLEALPGYGLDPYSERAKDKIRNVVGIPDAEVEFIVGGTQANAVVISTMLSDYEGVLAAKTGHISTHEAGAVEYTGHEVLELPASDGKITAADLQRCLSDFYADESYEHMTFPGMVYLSYPTEYGTLYTKRELTEISKICKTYRIPLFLDGARLAYGLSSDKADLTIRDLAGLCDVFTIGGTKAGALCGEAVVFTRKNKPKHFMTSVKKRGALLAKGRLTGIQFDALFTDDLYFKIGAHAIGMANKLKEILKNRGLTFAIDSPTNQQFVILENELLKRLRKEVELCFWENYDKTHTVVRFATSWSTTQSDLAALEKALDQAL